MWSRCCKFNCEDINGCILYKRGILFPDAPNDGDQFYRTDLFEDFHFSTALSRWVGESQHEGYGDSGGLSNNQYFRRFNGMELGPDRGVGLPYDIIITEHSVNWETPNNATGDVEIEINGANQVGYELSTIGDGPSHNYPNLIVPSNSIISFRRNGATLNNSQGRIRFKRLV